MKALSLRQPWATMIVTGMKAIENRKWKSNYRGSLLIHASKTWDFEGAKYILSVDRSLLGFVDHDDHYKGGIIGKVEMVDCIERVKVFDIDFYALEFEDPETITKWFFGPYGFIFKDPIEFHKPIEYKGQLGIFEVPMIL